MSDIGYLYALSDGKKVKIGKSIYPARRIRSLINTCGISSPEVFVSSECSMVSKKENICHSVLAKHLISGEWFSCAFKDAIETIKSTVKHENLRDKKLENIKKSLAVDVKISELTNSMLCNNNSNKSEIFDFLIDDTAKLISICEDKSLSKSFSFAKNSVEGILFLRCSGLEDVIKQLKNIISQKEELISLYIQLTLNLKGFDNDNNGTTESAGLRD